MKFLWLWFDALPPSQPVSAAPSTLLICLTLFTSSLLPPTHWHLYSRKERWVAWQPRRIRLIEIDGSGPGRTPFYYSCSKKGYQGVMEPCSLAELFCVYRTCKGVGREIEREINLNCNWYKVSHRMVGGSRIEEWFGGGVGNTALKLTRRTLCGKKCTLWTRGQLVGLLWL